MNKQRHTRTRAQQSRRAAASIANAIENLEPRRLLSTVTSTDLDIDGRPDLVIKGTSTADEVNVYLNPEPDDLGDPLTVVQDVKTGKLYGFDVTFEAIEVKTYAGDDKVNFYILSDYDEVTQGIHVDLGDGKDKFSISSPVEPFASPSGDNAADTAHGGAGINSSGTSVTPITAAEFGGDLVDTDLLLEVKGGSGADCINLDFTRTSLFASKFKLNVTADADADTVNLDLPDYREEAFVDILGSAPNPAGLFFAPEGIYGDFIGTTSTGAAGPHTAGGFSGYIPSQFIIKLDTGTGSTNTVNILAPTVLFGGSLLNIAVEGNSGVDKVNLFSGIATVQYDYFIKIPNSIAATTFKLDVNLYGGNDQMTAYLDYSGSPLNNASVKPAGLIDDTSIYSDYGTVQHYGFNGGTGDDKCKFYSGDLDGHRYTEPQESNTLRGLTEFILKGGAGNDEILVDLDTPAANEDSTIFLGTDVALGSTPAKIRIVLNGDAGDDKLEIDMNVEFDDSYLQALAIYPVIDWAENGGDGHDKVILAANVNTLGPAVVAGVTYAGPLHAVRMDGGNDTDEWDVDGNVTYKKFSLEGSENDSLEPGSDA